MISIAAMQKRIDDLEFEVAELRAALTPPQATVPLDWKLVGPELRLMTAMAARELLTKDQGMILLYAGIPGGEERDPKNLDVYICKIRKKVGPFGVSIATLWGRGWSLDKMWRDRIMGKAA
jgi:two-component system cell cycle response regulator CtrA